MLLNNFYTATAIKDDAEGYTVKVELNANHEIYRGHFPEQPVVPGVCIMQMVKECVEKIKGLELYYAQIQSCKFLSVINPRVDNMVEIVVALVQEDDSGISIQAAILQKEQLVAKLKAVLKQL